MNEERRKNKDQLYQETDRVEMMRKKEKEMMED